jgi:hypothetical protein
MTPYYLKLAEATLSGFSRTTTSTRTIRRAVSAEPKAGTDPLLLSRDPGNR